MTLIYILAIIALFVYLGQKLSQVSTMQNNYSQLHIGMSKREVIMMFGEPHSRRLAGNREILRWEMNEWKGFIRGGRLTRSVSVEFEDGVVVGYDGNNINVTKW